MLTTQIIQELITGLTQLLGNQVHEIILYGSVARHEHTSESDIDIALILNNSLTSGQREQLIQWTSEFDLKYERVFSIVDIDLPKMTRWKNILPFYKNIYEEGITLWRAA